jgi:DNA-binding SARP family transcriptional activator
MTRLRITLLGGAGIQSASGDVIALPGRKAQALLGYLALQRGQFQQRDKLAALLWPQSPHERARHNLRQLLLVIRTALPPSVLREVGETVALDLEQSDVDVLEFERLVTSGGAEAHQRATALYQGDLLAGLGEQSGAYEDWLLYERERLREVALDAFTKLLAHHVEMNAVESAIHTAVRLLALDPTQEGTHRTLMRLYVRQGRRAAALKQYQLCVEMLRRELGVEPDAQTRQVYQEVLKQRGPGQAPVPAAKSPGPSPPERDQPPVEPLAHGAPLIGRSAEVAQLRAALEKTWKGYGQIMVVLGEAGVGKTRLIEELVDEVGRRGGRALVGRSYESTQILPFGPWVHALRSARIFREAEIVGLAPIWRAELARLLPELAAEGLPAPSDDYLRLFESVTQLIERLASTRPLVVMLEDLHWADEMSLRLLSFLGRRSAALPLAVVGTAREEELVDAVALCRALRELDREANAGRMSVSALSRAETASLVQALARGDRDTASLARLQEQIWIASEGNPFMVLETLRGLEQDARTHTPAASVPLPDRVREVVAARLERLSAAGRQLAAVAAVIGREFEFTLLERAAELPRSQAAEGVEELVRRRVLRGAGDGFDFTHDRIREVAYAQLSTPRRALLHARVASALEELLGEDPGAHAGALGHHCWHAELWSKAVAYLRQAGTQAASRSAHAQAVAYFERALQALQLLPKNGETLAQAVDVRFELRTSLVALGDFGRIVTYLREAEVLVGALGDERRRGWLAVYLAHYFMMMGDLPEVERWARTASSIATAIDDFDLRVGATHYAGWARLASGDYRGAEAHFRDVIALLDGRHLHERCGLTGFPAVMARWLLAISLADRGEFDEAIAQALEAARIADALEHAFSRVLGFWAPAYVSLVKGAFVEAVDFAERALGIAREWHIDYLAPFVMGHLGAMYAHVGRVQEGLSLMEQALEILESSTSRVFHALLVERQGEAHLLAGYPNAALSCAERALALARARGERGNEARALWLRGAIASHGDPPDRTMAEAAFGDALALAEELGMRPLVAHCHLGLGKLYRTGADKQAAEHLDAAAPMYREMRMRFWLEQAEAKDH